METTSSPTSTEPSASPARWSGPLLAWLALAGLQVGLAFYGASQAEDDDSRQAIFEYELAVGGTIVYGILIALTFWIGSRYEATDRALGLTRFATRWIWIGFGIVLASLVVARIFEPILHGGEEQGLAPERWESDRVGAFVANAVVIVLIGPFAEELFYRGLGVTVFRGFGALTAIVATAVIFGLAHGILGALPPLVFFALGLAWIRLRSDSVWPGFVAHAGYNGIGILVAAYLAMNPEDAPKALAAFL